MTHRDQIERAIREWGWPGSLGAAKASSQSAERAPVALAMAVGLHDQYPDVTPIYDDRGNLTGWRGIELRGI